ncbi:hypothetical protein ACWEQ4_01170 [Rhodococcus sp. NPDC003994]
MGKPLSAAHKAAISKALRERNSSGSPAPRKTSAERRAARTPEQVAASKERRAARRAAKKEGAAPAAPAAKSQADERAARAEKTAKMNAALEGGSKPTDPAGKDFRSMSGADKTSAAERMFGTGSSQHEQAKAKFRDKPKAPAAPGTKFRDRKPKGAFPAAQKKKGEAGFNAQRRAAAPADARAEVAALKGQAGVGMSGSSKQARRDLGLSNRSARNDIARAKGIGARTGGIPERQLKSNAAEAADRRKRMSGAMDPAIRERRRAAVAAARARGGH